MPDDYNTTRNRITNGIGQDWMKVSIDVLEGYSELAALVQAKELYDLMQLRANEAVLERDVPAGQKFQTNTIKP